MGFFSIVNLISVNFTTFSIFFSEFCYFFIESVMDPEYNKKLKVLFKKYDTDKSGNISMEEMNLLVREINRDPQSSIDHFDADGDGVVNYPGELWNLYWLGDQLSNFSNRFCRKRAMEFRFDSKYEFWNFHQLG